MQNQNPTLKLILKFKRLMYRFGHLVYVMWWFLRRPHTRGVKCVLLYDDFVLLVRPSYGHQKWMIPGGGVHSGESWLQAAVRELREELGISADFEYFYEYQQIYEYKHDIVRCFWAEVSNQDFTIDGVEIVDAQWFQIHSLPPDCSPSVVSIIQNLLLHKK
jgi:8-oxo-dGTP pyrophosphatase MutT (NUDIX family)